MSTIHVSTTDVLVPLPGCQRTRPRPNERVTYLYGRGVTCTQQWRARLGPCKVVEGQLIQRIAAASLKRRRQSYPILEQPTEAPRREVGFLRSFQAGRHPPGPTYGSFRILYAPVSLLPSQQ